MAAFTTTKYESDEGSIHALLMSPERFAVAGTPPTGDINSSIKVKTSKTNKEFGLRPRGVRMARIVGAGEDTFRKYSFLPVLTSLAFGSSDFAIGASITVGSTTWEVVAKVNEDY